MVSFTTFIIAILFVFQAIGIYGDDDFLTGIAEAPAFNGSWYLCSTTNTKYISFSVRVLDDQTTPVTEGFPGQTLKGDPPKELPKFRPALLVYQLTYNDTLQVPTGTYNYIPSLSCYEKPVQSCDQDVGTLPLQFSERQCLLLVDPIGTPVRFNLTVSFTKSVFTSNFTSPNVPGGTDAKKTNTTSNSYKLEYQTNNSIIAILFSSILIYNLIGLF